MSVTLYGYKYSVYTWIARATLHEKAVGYEYLEINPFSPNLDDAYLELHPFKRVPALEHNGFCLYETCAITRYVDAAFEGINLQPTNSKALGRMSQIVSLIDSYGFQPMMREAFTNRVICEKIGLPIDEHAFAAAMVESKKVLRAIDQVSQNTQFLCGERVSLADLQLAPIMDCFQMFEEGRDLLNEFDKLARWYNAIRTRPSVKETRPMF